MINYQGITSVLFPHGLSLIFHGFMITNIIIDEAEALQIIPEQAKHINKSLSNVIGRGGSCQHVDKVSAWAR